MTASVAHRELVERELTILSAIYRRDQTAMTALMAPDGFGVDPDFGHKRHPDLIENITTAEIEHWGASNFQVSWLTSDAYVIAYELSQKGAYRGEQLPEHMACSTVWWRAQTGWQALMHQESHADR